MGQTDRQTDNTLIFYAAALLTWSVKQMTSFKIGIQMSGGTH